MDSIGLWVSVWLTLVGALFTLAFKYPDALRRLIVFVALPAALALAVMYFRWPETSVNLDPTRRVLAERQKAAADLANAQATRLSEWGSRAKDDTFVDLHDNFGINRGKSEAYADALNQLPATLPDARLFERYGLPMWVLWNLAVLGLAPVIVLALHRLLFPSGARPSARQRRELV